MLKKLIARYTPDHRTIKEHKHLQIFGKVLHDPNLWHLNRRSVSLAFAVGLFTAFMPAPGQMIIAAASAIAFKANLPISVALVWLTNPVTIAPVSYFCYRIGLWVLQIPEPPETFAFTPEWVLSSLRRIWQPFLLGSFLVGGASAALGYGAVRLFWRIFVIMKWKRRGLERNASLSIRVSEERKRDKKG